MHDLNWEKYAVDATIENIRLWKQQGSDQRKNLILFRKRTLNVLLARLKIHFQGNNQQYNSCFILRLGGLELTYLVLAPKRPV